METDRQETIVLERRNHQMKSLGSKRLDSLFPNTPQAVTQLLTRPAINYLSNSKLVRRYWYLNIGSRAAQKSSCIDANIRLGRRCAVQLQISVTVIAFCLREFRAEHRLRCLIYRVLFKNKYNKLIKVVSR